MAKIVFKKELEHLYKAPTKEVSIVEVPEMNFLMCYYGNHTSIKPIADRRYNWIQYE